MIEYSRNIGRIMALLRWVMAVFIAIDLLHPADIYSAKQGWLGSMDAPSLSPALAVGLLFVWAAVTSWMEGTLEGTSRGFVLGGADLVLALFVTYTQRTVLGGLLFGLPVLELMVTNLLIGGATAVTVIVLYLGIMLVKAHARPEALLQAWSFGFIPYIALTAGLGFIHHALTRQEDQVKALVSVIETSQELGTSASQEKILQLVTSDVMRLFDCSSVVVYLRDLESQTEPVMRVASQLSPAESFTDFNPELATSVIGAVIKEKKGRVVDDFAHYQPEEAIRKHPALRSAMVAPLLFEDQALGAIFIAHDAPAQYTDPLFRLFNMLANQVALAVRNLQLHKTTETLAITDSLSGLFTHGYFQEHLGKEIVSAKYASKPLSLMIIDVDFFKKVNDSYGHPQGDALLKQLGGVIKQVARPTDVICRYGGDEFTVTMLNTNRISAVVIAERIRSSVEDYEFVLGSQIVHVTVSGGVASFPEDAQTKKDLIEKADKAMYESKKKGRNCISFSA
ncbi:MAG: sensor domain-containing diguanylate cyclase [Proteobacteria bacterium]|nr:sensor domain-containing diguanylate cyclase [Pseudomonadota bacterium]